MKTAAHSANVGRSADHSRTTHRGPAVYRCGHDFVQLEIERGQASKCDIYFVRMEVDVRPIKIGRSTATGKRFKMLQCSSPYPLTCIGLLYGEGKFEPEWHRQFDELRMFGEWFRPSANLDAAIEVALKEGSRKALGLPPPFDWRAELGL
jgi:hypothetical protein